MPREVLATPEIETLLVLIGAKVPRRLLRQQIWYFLLRLCHDRIPPRLCETPPRHTSHYRVDTLPSPVLSSGLRTQGSGSESLGLSGSPRLPEHLDHPCLRLLLIGSDTSETFGSIPPSYTVVRYVLRLHGLQTARDHAVSRSYSPCHTCPISTPLHDTIRGVSSHCHTTPQVQATEVLST